MRLWSWALLVVLALALTGFLTIQSTRALHQSESGPGSQDWPVWNGSPANLHYSSLSQINRSNVKQLRLAWSYDTGEKGGMQTSPLVVGRILYGISPTQKVFALEASDG